MANIFILYSARGHPTKQPNLWEHMALTIVRTKTKSFYLNGQHLPYQMFDSSVMDRCISYGMTIWLVIRPTVSCEHCSDNPLEHFVTVQENNPKYATIITALKIRSSRTLLCISKQPTNVREYRYACFWLSFSNFQLPLYGFLTMLLSTSLFAFSIINFDTHRHMGDTFLHLVDGWMGMNID